MWGKRENEINEHSVKGNSQYIYIHGQTRSGMA